MNWRKVKKLIIPLIIVKLIFFVFFIFKSNLVSISRDINYSTNYQAESGNDSPGQNRQKLIRIVRNENEPGISIKLRGRKNNKASNNKEQEIVLPEVD